MNHGRGILTLVVAAASLAGCEGAKSGVETESPRASATRGSPTETGQPIRIVTTCGMVTDIVQQVAGERATVTGLMGEDVDPHLFKPTRNDVKQLMEADVVFYSGLMLEGRMGDTFAKVGRSGKPVFAVTEGIDESYLREPAEFEGHADPHVWMDVAAWSACVEFAAKSLAEYDPTHAAEYQSRAAAYRQELQRLDDYAKKCIASIPEDQRILVTAHDAFGYFARAYGIRVESAQGLSTESDAGVEDINRLVKLIVDKQLKAIFVESSVNPKNIQAVIEGAASRDHAVAVGGQLYSDAMGPRGTYAGTYVGMMDHNVTTIARALGGEAPVGGLNGKLKGK